VTPFRTILGAISRSPFREFPRRYQALSFVFVESLAHLAVNMATIMSYAAETSTILTFLATLPAARAYWRKPDRKHPKHHAHRGRHARPKEDRSLAR